MIHLINDALNISTHYAFIVTADGQQKVKSVNILKRHSIRCDRKKSFHTIMYRWCKNGNNEGWETSESKCIKFCLRKRMCRPNWKIYERFECELLGYVPSVVCIFNIVLSGILFGFFTRMANNKNPKIHEELLQPLFCCCCCYCFH